MPHDRIQRSVTVLADLQRIRIFDRHECIAEHPRSWDKQQVVENPQHIADLWRDKRRARSHRGQDRLARSVPQTQTLLQALAQRQRHLATAISRLVFLLDTYGAQEMQRAVDEALGSESPHPETVRLILERRAHQQGKPPTLPIPMPKDSRLDNLTVTPHSLQDYDLQEDS